MSPDNLIGSLAKRHDFDYNELRLILNLSLRVINTIVFIPKVLSSRGGVFLFFFRVYRRRVAGKCLLEKFSFPTR